MSSASKQFELEKKLKEAEKKIALYERLSKLGAQLIEFQTEMVTQLTELHNEKISQLGAQFIEFETEMVTQLTELHNKKISQLEVELKESLQANADCAMKLSGLQRQLQQSEQSKPKFETSFNSMQAKFNMTNSALDTAMLRISASGIDADPRMEVHGTPH